MVRQRKEIFLRSQSIINLFITNFKIPSSNIINSHKQNLPALSPFFTTIVYNILKHDSLPQV